MRRILVAIRKPKHRSDARVEPFALGEFRARVDEIPLFDQRPTLFEQHLCRRFLLRRIAAVCAGR
jgi:hypothetical protein